MCKPGGGNNRCPIHQRGSIATLNTTTQLTGTPRDEATVVFKELAAEGGNLQPPTQEMVLSFAETQRLHAKYNPTLTHAAREKITNQWEQAKEENPSGGTFHAWRNTLSEVVRRQRSNMRVIGASLALSAVISGCGGAVKGPTPTPTVSQPSDGGGVEVLPTPVDKIDYERNAEHGIALSDTELSDPHGSYNPVVLTDDSPLLQYDKSKVQESVFYAFDDEEVESAQNVVSRFAVENQDSTLLWDNSAEAKSQWLETNKPKFADNVHGDLEQAINEPSEDGYYVTNGNANGWKDGVGEPIYVEGQPRLAFEDAELVSVTGFIEEETGKESLRFDYSFLTYEDVYNEEQQANGVIVNRVNQAYAVSRDGNGGWSLNGWEETAQRQGVDAGEFSPDKEYAVPSDGGGDESSPSS